jgi:RNA polymerase sigma-70 factor (ECF subfamily)
MNSPTRDRAWFVEKVRESQSRLRASIRGLGVRAEAVDDVAQDVFVLAWQKRDEFDGSGDFGGWVVQIARRLVANERRKDNRRNRLLSGEVTDLLLHETPAPSGPLEQLEHQEDLAALRGCLAQLPPSGREMIRLRYFEHLSPGSIAGRLGRPSNYVRQSLLRLRRLLSECLGGRLANGEGTS